MRHRCAAVAALSLILFAAGPVATARSEPPPPEATSDPFPDVRYYDELNANDFAQPGGVWFIGPAGQNCLLWRQDSRCRRAARSAIRAQPAQQPRITEPTASVVRCVSP
jgi:hypothetical protein